MPEWQAGLNRENASLACINNPKMEAIAWRTGSRVSSAVDLRRPVRVSNLAQ